MRLLYGAGRLRAQAKATANNNVGSGQETGTPSFLFLKLACPGLGILTVTSQFCFMSGCLVEANTPEGSVVVRDAAVPSLPGLDLHQGHGDSRNQQIVCTHCMSETGLLVNETTIALRHRASYVGF